MRFEIIWTERAKKDLKNIEKVVCERIINKVYSASESDNLFLEKIKNQQYHKIRIGNYRIIVQRVLSTKTLIVLRVGHRKNIHKKI